MILRSVYNRNTNEEVLKEKCNRRCELGFDSSCTKMIIRFQNGGTLKHYENVEYIKQSSNEITVATAKKLWIFEKDKMDIKGIV